MICSQRLGLNIIFILRRHLVIDSLPKFYLNCNYQPSNASLRVSKGLRSFSLLVSQTERMMQNASAPPTARKPPITFSLILGAHQALGEVVVERDAPVGEEP